MKPTMLSYILSEKEVLLNILSQYDDITIPQSLIKPNTEVLVLATGSSINVANSVKHFVEERLKVRINIQEPYNFLHYGSMNPETSLIIGISQSGQSTSTIEAIDSLKKVHDIPSMAITTIPNSEITEYVDYTLIVKCGEERVGYVTLGYVSNILEIFLHSLKASVMLKITNLEEEQTLLRLLKENISQIDTIQKDTLAFFEEHKEAFKEANRLVSVGYGPNFGTAKEMETKFSETIRVPSSGYDLEAYMHGPYLEVNPEHHIFFIMTHANVLEKANLLHDYESKHAHTYRISTINKENKNDLFINCSLPESLTPLLLVIPFQLLCWYVASEKGIDLTQRIYTDFSQAVKSKTKVQNYV